MRRVRKTLPKMIEHPEVIEVQPEAEAAEDVQGYALRSAFVPGPPATAIPIRPQMDLAADFLKADAEWKGYWATVYKNQPPISRGG